MFNSPQVISSLILQQLCRISVVTCLSQTGKQLREMTLSAQDLTVASGRDSSPPPESSWDSGSAASILSATLSLVRPRRMAVILRMLCTGLAAMRMDLHLAVLRASLAPLHGSSWRG